MRHAVELSPEELEDKLFNPFFNTTREDIVHAELFGHGTKPKRHLIYDGDKGPQIVKAVFLILEDPK